MLTRIRISVPDRPGSLGRVASAIGSAGGDIAKVDVLESEGGRALDDVFVQVRDVEQLGRVTANLESLAGVQLLGTQQPVPPVSGHSDLELVRQVLANPGRALQTLVDGAPGALGADWSALLRFDAAGTAEVVARSVRAAAASEISFGAPNRLASLTLTPAGSEIPFAGAALVPLEGTEVGLLLIREQGVDFHRSELWRLGQLGALLGPILGLEPAV